MQFAVFTRNCANMNWKVVDQELKQSDKKHYMRIVKRLNIYIQVKSDLFCIKNEGDLI